MPSNHLILCRPLLLLPSIFPSIRVFSSESARHIRWPKYWSFSSSISPSNEHPGLISFRMDWLDLLAVQGTLKSLQHHSSKASILWRSAFFIVQLSHPYMTTGKTIALTRQTFVGKVTALFFTVLSRLVIIFLPRGKLGYRWPFKEIVWVFFSLLLEVTRWWGFSPVPFACSAVESMRGVWVIGNLPEGWGAAFIAPVHVNRSGGGGWRAHTVLPGAGLEPPRAAV